MSNQTRRDWLITIGAVAAASSVAEQLDGDNGPSTALPPGVYGPSSDHLGHALMNAERYHPIPPGCPTEYVRPRTGPFEPQFFSRTEFPVIRRLVQLILGENSDQSESVEETAEWIDLCASEAGDVRKAAGQIDSMRRALAVACYGAARANRFEAEDAGQTCKEGLAWITRQSKDFLSLSPGEQEAVVKAMSEANVENAGGQFFAFLKTETIKAFYTSQTGLKELDYKGNAFYARSPGCAT